MDLLLKYFPGLTETQKNQFVTLARLLPPLNEGVNVISRKDVAHLEERHILHSLAIAKQYSLSGVPEVLDLGTGGGFPGIPLAILYPDTHFILSDSIAKKIRLVSTLCEALELKNTSPVHGRAEQIQQKYHLVVTRAVAPMEKIYHWTRRQIYTGKSNHARGIIALKGGDLGEELRSFSGRVKVNPVSDHFEESFFSTKMIVYLKI